MIITQFSPTLHFKRLKDHEENVGIFWLTYLENFDKIFGKDFTKIFEFWNFDKVFGSFLTKIFGKILTKMIEIILTRNVAKIWQKELERKGLNFKLNYIIPLQLFKSYCAECNKFYKNHLSHGKNISWNVTAVSRTSF